MRELRNVILMAKRSKKKDASTGEKKLKKGMKEGTIMATTTPNTRKSRGILHTMSCVLLLGGGLLCFVFLLFCAWCCASLLFCPFVILMKRVGGHIVVACTMGAELVHRAEWCARGVALNSLMNSGV